MPFPIVFIIISIQLLRYVSIIVYVTSLCHLPNIYRIYKSKTAQGYYCSSGNVITRPDFIEVNYDASGRSW